MVRTATPFPMVSLLFVFTAFVISNIGHIRPQRTILAFVSGIFFILSGTMHSISLFVMHGYMFFLRFVLIRALSLCSGARCAKTQILFSRGTTTDSKLLSCVVSTFSNYSAVCWSGCKGAWETNPSAQLSENLWRGSLWRHNWFAQGFKPSCAACSSQKSNQVSSIQLMVPMNLQLRFSFCSFGPTSHSRSQRFIIKWLNPDRELSSAALRLLFSCVTLNWTLNVHPVTKDKKAWRIVFYQRFKWLWFPFIALPFDPAFLHVVLFNLFILSFLCSAATQSRMVQLLYWLSVAEYYCWSASRFDQGFMFYLCSFSFIS